MRIQRSRQSAAGRTVYGIDRMVRNVETGRFERSLSHPHGGAEHW